MEKIKIKNKNAALIALFLLFALSLSLLPAAALADTDTAALKAVLKAYIEGRYHWQDVGIKGLRLSADGRPAGKETSLPRDIEITKAPPGDTVFDLRFGDGQKVKAAAYVTACQAVVKSKRLLIDGSVIGPDDVYVSKEDVSRLEEGSFSDEASVAGAWLTRSVGPNVTISKDMISFRPLVKRGRKVTVIIESPSFRITTTGQMLQDARVGTYAKVINTSSKKMLYGLLSDVDTVRIEEGPR